MGAIPAIFPVNYAFAADLIVFRTAPGSKLSAATEGAVVAFEVDEFDGASRSGWSVLVVGRSQVVHDLDTTFKVLDVGLEPWADGVRSAIVRIDIEMISGRRIRSEEHTSELQSLMRISYAVFCLKKKNKYTNRK